MAARLPVSDEITRVIPSEGLVLLAGGIGSGKSALGYALLESIHLSSPDRRMYAFNFPSAKKHLLPPYIDVTYEDEFPEHSVVIADEAYFAYYSKDHQSDANRFMDRFSGLSRQKGILTIFITQTTRKLSLAAVSGVQVFLVKCPDIMMVKLDRSELRKTLSEALTSFRKLPLEERQRATYVVSIDYEGLVRDSNRLPSFWSDELSRAWEGVPLQQRLAGDSRLNVASEVDSIYRRLNLMAVESWDDDPILRDCLIRCADLLEPVFKGNGDLTLQLARDIQEHLAEVEFNRESSSLLTLRRRIEHLTEVLHSGIDNAPAE